MTLSGQEVPRLSLQMNTGNLVISFSGGTLEQSQDLKNWAPVDPLPFSPFHPPLLLKSHVFRVRAYSTEDRVPIIAFTGQSNTLHTRRNYEPYSSTQLPLRIGLTTGPGAVAGTVQLYDEVTKATQNAELLGAVWDFTELLHESDYRAGKAIRFAVTQSGAGGWPATDWTFARVRGIEFQDVVDRMITSLDTEPNTSGYLHAVVVNQGEREGTTGLNWAEIWSTFIDAVRIKYGNQVQFYIQSLNGINLMPLQADKPYWIATRDRQFSLATGSGSPYERAATFVFDSNALGGGENTALYVRDHIVHYSNLGIRRLAEGTFDQFRTANGF